MANEIFYIIIITLGIIVISIMMSAKILQGIVTFTYFFAKGSSEAVSDGLSELITVSAGTPGNVEINYGKPSDTYEYDLLFGKSFVVVDAKFKANSLPLGFQKEELEKLFRKTSSGTGTEFTAPDSIENFDLIKIKKGFSASGLKVEVVK